MIDIRLATDFGDLIARMLRGNRATVPQLMKVLGCSKAMVYKYRSKKSSPSSEALQRFAKQYGYQYVDVLQLARGKEEGPPPAVYMVSSEQAQRIGRLYERLPDHLKATFYQLLVSLADQALAKPSGEK